MPAMEEIMLSTPTLQADQTCPLALQTLQQSGRSSLPVVSADGRYVGMLSENDCWSASPSDLCADVCRRVEAMQADEPLTSLARLFAEQDTDTVAVMDRNGVVVGCADRQQTLKALSHMLATDEMGCNISVRVHTADFELTRIVSIVEQTGAKLLSVVTERSADFVVITIKTNQLDALPIIESLERFGYETMFWDQKSQYIDSLRRNYNELMKYLEM